MFSKRLIPSLLVAAGLSAGVSSVARAADYSPPCYDAEFIASGRAPYGAVPCYRPAPVVEEFSGWYLRGDIGMSNQQVKSLTNPAASSSITSSSYGFDSAPIFGLGVGYYFNDWLRFDMTGEYRGRANFHGNEIYATTPSPSTDEYNGAKSEWLFLANAYVDLGTWNSLTPFVGAGVGFSRNTIHSFQDACHACGGNVSFTGIAFADDVSKWNFAWAVYAGLAYKVSRNLTVELAYRYLDMGNAETGNITPFDGSAAISGSTFERLTSHDVRLGMRFNFDGFESFGRPASYYPPPPVYAPAPVYQQPLHSKG